MRWVLRTDFLCAHVLIFRSANAVSPETEKSLRPFAEKIGVLPQQRTHIVRFSLRSILCAGFACPAKQTKTDCVRFFASIHLIVYLCAYMLFADLVGQELLSAHLRSLVAQNRVGQGHLFFSAQAEALPLALAFAQYVHCQNSSVADACGNCQSCKMHQKMQHPDVYYSFPVVQEASTRTSLSQLDLFRKQVLANPYLSLQAWNEALDGAKKQALISVHESVELLRFLQLKSVLGGYKIVLVFGFETLNIAAANKLLKSLEEPEEKVLFLLVAENLELVLPTLRSRVQLHVLERLSLETLTHALLAHTQSQEEAFLLAQSADASYAKALELCQVQNKDQNYFTQFTAWMRICFKKDVSALVQWVDQMAGEGRETQKEFLRYALRMFRAAVLQNYAPNAEIMPLQGEQQVFNAKFAPYIQTNNIIPFQQALENAHQDLLRNAHAKILFLDTSFQLFKALHKP